MVIAVLLLLNHWQISKSDPVESHVVEALVTRLRSDPNNAELINEIRNFDLLARKAYFNSQWQIKTGSYLLLGGAILLIAALTVYYTLKSKISKPDKDHEDEIAGRLLAQKWVVATGLIVFGLAFVLSFSSVNYLERYKVETSLASLPEPVIDEGVELIDVVPVQEVSVSVEELNNPLEASVPEHVPAEKPVSEKLNNGEKQLPSGLVTPAVLNIETARQNHNTFRGPLGQGVSWHKNIPTKWNGTDGRNILWKAAVPKRGYNSPVIWKDKIFVTGADNQVRELYCYNRTDGKLLWTAKADNIPGSPSVPPRVTEDTGLAASTAATDGNHVYSIFATGDVMAVDMSGKRVWARNLGVPDNHYGHSSSLMVWENKLLVQFDTNKGGKLMALNTAAGETLWETARDAKISWASPVLAQVNGKYQVVLTADPIVAGYDIQTGKELWSVKCMMGEVGPSVAFYDGVVYAANEYAKMVAIDINTREILWEEDMYLPEASSPLAHEGLVFVATSYGVLACYDAKTGEEYWEHDVGKTLYSSPVYADKKLFLMDNDGIMRIYEYGREMKLIAENELGEPAGSTPAFADGQVFIRGEEHLFCIGE